MIELDWLRREPASHELAARMVAIEETIASVEQQIDELQTRYDLEMRELLASEETDEKLTQSNVAPLRLASSSQRPIDLSPPWSTVRS